jgi:hypothetical protein
MNEQQLRDFGARAESVVEIPDFAELDRRGRGLQVRRRVSVATAVAAVLAVVGVTVAQSHRTDADHGPVTPPNLRTEERTYPGGTMKTLDEGTYVLHPSFDRSDLRAELSVPTGWNAWVGPNRFDGHAPGRSNDEALGHMTWYVGALVMEVDEVNTHGCGDPDPRVLETPREVVRAIRRAFSTEVLRAPVAVHKFGYSATRMRLRVTPEADDCRRDAVIFSTTADGFIQYAPPGTVVDVWIVEIDGRPIFVQSAWTPNAPSTVRTQLDGVIDSIRFRNAE